MARPKPPHERANAKEPLFVTWDVGDDAGKQRAIAQASKACSDQMNLVDRAVGTTVYQNIAPQNTSVRDGFDKRDYDYFRPGEASPRTQRDVIAGCMQAYDKIGIIRNVIDTMGDFAAGGIDLAHPNPRIEAVYKKWAKIVGMKERSERFANTLCRTGNVVVKRHKALLPEAYRKNIELAMGSTGGNGDIKPQKPMPLKPGEIPWKYTILNPLQVDVIGGDLAPFIGQLGFSYALLLPAALIRKVKHPANDAEKALIKKLPPKVRQGLKDGNRSVPLDDDELVVFYYKKDDWQVWANPFFYSILDNLITLKKMELADRAALDGALSHIRLWRLGSLENRILPTAAGIAQLSTLLLNSSGNGGVLDLIWGPELDLKETSTDVHQFLGSAKYQPLMDQIYAGLGIPPTLTGGENKGGFTNNFISLRVLIERLQYVRNQLTEFWEYEIRLFQRGMGFKQPARLIFDRMTLTDESAILALYLQLLDRNVISAESVQRRFGEVPDIENTRLRRETRQREAGRLPQKVSPFHNPTQEQALETIFAQSGAYTPSEFGVDLLPAKPGQKTPLEVKMETTPVKTGPPGPGGPAQPETPSGVPQQGRPVNSKDTEKRKQKVVKPRSAKGNGYLDALLWAEAAQEKIAEITTPLYLQSLGKKNLRQLTTSEARDFEDFKFALLCSLPEDAEVTETQVAQAMSGKLAVPAEVQTLFQTTLGKYVEKHGAEPTLEWTRQLRAKVYSLYAGAEGDGEDAPAGGDSV